MQIMDTTRQYSKPLVYHQNLIDALANLKARAPDDTSWVSDTDPELVSEARTKGCIVDGPGGPTLTARGEVVSRMRVRFKRGQNLDAFFDSAPMVAIASLVLVCVLTAMHVSPLWALVPLLIFCAAMFWKAQEVEVTRVVDIVPPSGRSANS